MQSIVLTPRLDMVAALIPPGARVADVGTDHAYLPVWLLQNGAAERVIACDLRPGPLGRAGETVGKYGLTGRIDLRLCDGLGSVSPDEVDTIVVAGMGGETVLGILEAAPWARDCTCVLQPMSKQFELRGWLVSNGYRITEERICCEGDSLYVAISATGGTSKPYTEAELHAGQQATGLRDPLRGAYLDTLIQKTAWALAGVRRSSAQQTRAEALSGLLEELHEMKREWDVWQR